MHQPQNVFGEFSCGPNFPAIPGSSRYFFENSFGVISLDLSSKRFHSVISVNFFAVHRRPKKRHDHEAVKFFLFVTKGINEKSYPYIVKFDDTIICPRSTILVNKLRIFLIKRSKFSRIISISALSFSVRGPIICAELFKAVGHYPLNPQLI